MSGPSLGDRLFALGTGVRVAMVDGHALPRRPAVRTWSRLLRSAQDLRADLVGEDPEQALLGVALDGWIELLRARIEIERSAPRLLIGPERWALRGERFRWDFAATRRIIESMQPWTNAANEQGGDGA